MNLKEFRKEQIKKKFPKDTFIDFNILSQCQELTPERRNVGKDVKGNLIFFEETGGSLRNRHYGKSTRATSFNLLFSNGEKSEKITKEYLINNEICFSGDYDKTKLIDFLEKNNHRFNGFNEMRKPYQFKLTPNEHEIVKKFIKKMRVFNENEKQEG